MRTCFYFWWSIFWFCLLHLKNPAKQLFLLKTFCSLCSHKIYIYKKFNRIFLFFWPFFHPRSHTEHWFFIFLFFSQFTQFQIWKKKNFCLKKSTVTRFSLIFYFYLNEIPPCVVYLEKTFLFYSWIFFFFLKKWLFLCLCFFNTWKTMFFLIFFFSIGFRCRNIKMKHCWF